MNTFLIKIGKSWQVIKRDGLINGSKRVLSAFFALFRKVGSGDILFISGGVGDSALHRTTHIAEELEFNGFKCSVTVQDNPRLVSYVNKFSIFIFHRTLNTKKITKLIEEIKKQNKTIIFETDDLVYDPKYLEHMDYYEKMNNLEKKLYENGVGGEILKDEYVKVATTTTKFLADKLRQENKTVFRVLNKLSKKDVNDAKVALLSLRQGVPQGHNKLNSIQERDHLGGEGGMTTKQSKKNVEDAPSSLRGGTTKQSQKDNEKTVKLGYFSGTISHNKDFATITEPLMTILEKYKNVELLLVGPLDVESDLVKRFGDRIKQLPYVKRSKHFANIAQCDINLAPLEYNNPFCEAKSELKFFEAGIVKVPTIAIDNQTYQDAIEDGIDGFTARNAEEWTDKLSQLIENKDLRTKMGQKAYQKTINNYTTQNSKNIEYYEYLKVNVQK